MTGRAATWVVIAAGAVLAACSQHNRRTTPPLRQRRAAVGERGSPVRGERLLGTGVREGRVHPRPQPTRNSGRRRWPCAARRSPPWVSAADASRVLSDRTGGVGRAGGQGRRHARAGVLRGPRRPGRSRRRNGPADHREFAMTDAAPRRASSPARPCAGPASDSAAVRACSRACRARRRRSQRAIAARRGAATSRRRRTPFDSMVAWRDSTTPWDSVLAASVTATRRSPVT